MYSILCTYSYTYNKNEKSDLFKKNMKYIQGISRKILLIKYMHCNKNTCKCIKSQMIHIILLTKHIKIKIFLFYETKQKKTTK